MAKHTQTFCQLLPTNCLSVFNHFMGLALEGLIAAEAHSEIIQISKIDLFSLFLQNRPLRWK